MVQIALEDLVHLAEKVIHEVEGLSESNRVALFDLGEVADALGEIIVVLFTKVQHEHRQDILLLDLLEAELDLRFLVVLGLVELDFQIGFQELLRALRAVFRIAFQVPFNGVFENVELTLNMPGCQEIHALDLLLCWFEMPELG